MTIKNSLPYFKDWPTIESAIKKDPIIEDKIIEILNTSPSASIEIARKLKLSHATVIKYIIELTKINLIKKKQMTPVKQVMMAVMTRRTAKKLLHQLQLLYQLKNLQMESQKLKNY